MTSHTFQNGNAAQPRQQLDRSSMETPRLRRREALFLIEESAHWEAFDTRIL